MRHLVVPPPEGLLIFHRPLPLHLNVSSLILGTLNLYGLSLPR